jgi:Protein of unknown function (DUF3828)
MLTRRTILLGAAGAIIAAPAFADNAAALAFMTSIYDAYKGKNAKGIPLDNARTIQRYFEPSLAALISKDQKDAARRHDVPALDGDPFVDAQDWDITAFDVALANSTPNKTRATVSFRNAGQPVSIVLDLVTVNNDWRISDITWQHDGKAETLRGIYKH